MLGRHEFLKGMLRGVVPWQGQYALGVDVSLSARAGWVESSLKKVNCGQYASGHVPYSDKLFSLMAGNDIRVVQVIRDPRAVILSWAYYVPTQKWHYSYDALAGKDIEERISFLLSGGRSVKYYIESFSSVMRSIEGWLENKNVLTMKFEDLVGVRGGGNSIKQHAVIEEFLKFIGVSVDENHIMNKIYGGTSTFRKGQIDSWKDELSPNIIHDLNKKLGKYIVAFGYQLSL